jgi:hypothetical protein
LPRSTTICWLCEHDGSPRWQRTPPIVRLPQQAKSNGLQEHRRRSSRLEIESRRKVQERGTAVRTGPAAVDRCAARVSIDIDRSRYSCRTRRSSCCKRRRRRRPRHQPLRHPPPPHRIRDVDNTLRGNPGDPRRGTHRLRDRHRLRLGERLQPGRRRRESLHRLGIRHRPHGARTRRPG